MMRILLLLPLLIFNVLIFAAENDITIADIHRDGKFKTKSVWGMTFLNDGNYSKMERVGKAIQINKYSLKSGKKLSTLFDNQLHRFGEENLSIQGYSYNADESLIILETAKKKQYRHSYFAENFIFEVATKKVVKLSKGGAQMYATISPDGNKVAFVRDNNIYIRDIKAGSEYAITNEGKFNSIINGAGDWVYEEEFVLTRAFEWSGDGSKIAYVKFDELEVPQMDMPIYGGLYPKNYSFKYPKAGEANSKVSLHIFDLNTKTTVDVHPGNNSYYIPRIGWNNDILWFQTMNRHQNKLDLKLYDFAAGAYTVIWQETNRYYIDVTDHLTFLEDGAFIWSSERDGYNHLYLHSKEGRPEKQLTSGSFDVTDFYGYDPKSETIYYQSSQMHATQRSIYAHSLKKGITKPLATQEGSNSALFNKNFTYFLNYHSTLTSPTEISLFSKTGKYIRTLEDNKKLKEQVAQYGDASYEMIEVPLEDGTILNGKMMKPADFDSTKQYPLFMYVYGGPGSQTVNHSWGHSDFFWYNHLCDQGYVVVSVDNRGTGARGQEFKKCTYMTLGKIESDDQIAAAKYLAKQSYIDAKRIGIFGWSYGGYMSSLCLFKGADIFKMAIAVAPVTNWRYYDSIYTERYMRTPQENKEGYTENDPLHFAEGLKGKYLLIHGTADDNVHFQNAVDLTDRLIQLGKQFDVMYYPNNAHGMTGPGARFHLYTMMTNYIKNNL